MHDDLFEKAPSLADNGTSQGSPRDVPDTLKCTLQTASLPVSEELVPGRSQVLKLRTEQDAFQGPEVFKKLSLEYALNIEGLALGAECIAQDCEPTIDRYPSGDFIKALKLDNGKLLLMLIDFPGKGVIPTIDRSEHKILSEENCVVARKVLKLHALMTKKVAPAFIRYAHGKCGAHLNPIESMGSSKNPISLSKVLSELSLVQQSVFLEAYTKRLCPADEDYLAAALVLIDPQRGLAEYLNRGHPLPILAIHHEKKERWSVPEQVKIRSRCELISNENHSLHWPLPGVLPSTPFELQAGEQLIIMSDGIGDGRLSSKSEHYEVFREAIQKSSKVDTEPSFFSTILDLAPDALFAPNGRCNNPMGRIKEIMGIFRRRDDSSALIYTQGQIL